MSTQRLAELNAKGWPNLNKNERKERKDLEVALGVKSETPENSPKEIISISKDDLAAMIDQAVKNRLGGNPEDPTLAVGMWSKQGNKKPMIRTATLRCYKKDGDSPVGHIIDWYHLKNEYDENTRKHDKDIYKITVRYEGGKTEEVVMPYEQFGTINEKETVKILKQTVEIFEKNHGMVYPKRRTRDGYGTDDKLGNEVPALEIMEVYTATVLLPNGEQLTLPSNRLN